jgi:hypothetical protein
MIVTVLAEGIAIKVTADDSYVAGNKIGEAGASPITRTR